MTKLHQVVLVKSIVLASLVLLSISAEPVHAATPQKMVEVTDKDVFQVPRAKQKPVVCLIKKSKYEAGILKKEKKKLFFLSNSVRFKADLAKLKKNSSKKGKAAYLKLKKQLTDEQKLCSSGVDLAPHEETLTEAEARHLYRRAGFGGSEADIASAVRDGLTKTISKLFNFVGTPDLDAEAAGLFDGDPKETYDWVSVEGVQLVFLNYILKSPNPLKEKMALFWQSLFPASARNLSWNHSHFLVEYMNHSRDKAIGNFRAIAKALSFNGMMLSTFDGRYNAVGHINRSFARQFLENIVLNRGEFNENDIQETARGFAGYTIAYNETTEREEVYLASGLVDKGPKTLFQGTSYQMQGGFFGGDTVDAILDSHPLAAKNLARKLYRSFVKRDPSEKMLGQLADELKANNFEVAPTIKRILTSRAFFAPESRKAGIKNPVEFVAGYLKITGLKYDLRSLNWNMDRLGLDLFYPPVRGWLEDSYWLNDQWISQRFSFPLNMTNYVLSDDEDFSFRFLLPNPRANGVQFLDAMVKRMDVDLAPDERENMLRYFDYVRTWDEKDEPWLFDPRHENNFEAKARGALFILAQHQSYQMN